MTREEIIKEINNLTFTSIINQENYQFFEQVMIDADLAVVDCYLIARNLEEKVTALIGTAAEHYKLFEAYQEIIAFLRLRCFMKLSNEEAGHFMAYEAVKANRVIIERGLYYDFIENLYTSLDSIFDWERTKKDILLSNLKKNKELLGSQKLKFTGQAIEEEPYLNYWLKDYDLNTKANRERNNLDRLNYLNDSKLVKSLSVVERKVIIILLEVYDILKFSIPFFEPRKTADYWEREAAKLKMSKAIVISAPITKKQIPHQDLLKLYHQTITQFFSGKKDKVYLSAFQKISASEIIQKLEAALPKKDKELALATLTSLITKGQFAFLEQATLFKEWQADFLKSQPGIEAVNLTNKEQKDIIFSQFIKAVLKDKLGLAVQESSMVAMHLANLLKEQGQKNYLQMVYADLKSCTFKWREIKVENGQLRYI